MNAQSHGQSHVLTFDKLQCIRSALVIIVLTGDHAFGPCAVVLDTTDHNKHAPVLVVMCVTTQRAMAA